MKERIFIVTTSNGVSKDLSYIYEYIDFIKKSDLEKLFKEWELGEKTNER